MRWRGFSALVAALMPGLGACGAGTAAVGGLSGGGSGGTAPTTVSDVLVTSTKVSPATVRFTLVGRSAVSATLEYGPVGGAPVAVIAQADQLDASSTGVQHECTWPFSQDYEAGLQVTITLGNGLSARSDPDDPVTVGNRPPEIDESSVEFPPGELVGPVPLEFLVTDTDDLVDVRIEVNVEEAAGFPEAAWTLALPVLTPTVPDPTFDDVFASRNGSLVSFTWSVDQQFPSLDSGVLVRLRVNDQVVVGGTPEPLEEDVYVTPVPIQVDNNAPPTATLDDVGFLFGADRRGGIAVPYTVSDAEGDALRIVLQWSAWDEPFPALPDEGDELEVVLSDPDLRRQYRVATPYVLPVGGRTLPTAAPDVLELPELGGRQAGLLRTAEQPGGDLTHAMAGWDLELLRESVDLRPLSVTWPANPLDAPVAALPTSSGTSAFVLDGTGGAWRLREIALATGTVAGELASGPGEPDTMALERAGDALLVAARAGARALLYRVDLESKEVLPLLDEPAAGPGEGVHGIASESPATALFTLGTELLRLDYSDPLAPVHSVVLGGLASPWGVLVDPGEPNRVWLAERDGGAGGRLLSVSLDTFAVRELRDGVPLPLPEALAIDTAGDQLLVLTDEDPFDGVREVRAVPLSSSAPVRVIAAGPMTGTGGLASGADRLRLLAVPDGNELVAGGGVEQRRSITSYVPERRRVTVASPFVPAPRALQPWRVRPSSAELRLDAGVPRRGTFVWDSRELAGNWGEVRMRLTARDEDGTTVEHVGAKSIRSGLEHAPLVLGGPGTTTGPRAVAVGDLDGDGDLDVVSGNADSVAVFFQAGRGEFDPAPTMLGDAASTDTVLDLEVADLDGDGDLDLAAASNGTDTITVFFQSGPGAFDPAPLLVGRATTTRDLQAVSAADVDGDGDLDLVSANKGTMEPAVQALAVFYQTSPGVFDPTPLLVGGAGEVALPAHLTAADLDGDRDVDLLYSNSTGIHVHFQTATGVFDPTPVVLSGSVEASVAVADVDGDGDLDLASAVVDSLTVRFQTSPGVFDPDLLVLENTAAQVFIPWVTAADLDSDGLLDLVAPNVGAAALTAFFQSAPGVFVPEPLILSEAGVTENPRAIAAGDLNGDGALDLVSANLDSHTLSVFFHRDRGIFDPVPGLVGDGSTLSGPSSVAAFDADGDGDLDLVVGDAFLVPGGLRVFFQERPGVFDPDPVPLSGPQTRAPFGLTAADLDGDADLDLLTADFDSNRLSLFFQTVPGAFDSDATVLGGVPTGGCRSVAVGDVDGDGDLDFASANQGRNTLTVFFQTSAGVFDPAPLSLGSPATTERPFDVELADLDADGDLDLVSANFRANSLTVFFQTGPGLFDPAPLVLAAPATAGARAVAAGDLDGDGDLDLVSANQDADGLAVFFQACTGVFDPDPIVLSQPGVTLAPNDVEVGDLDGDGDLDIVSENAGTNTLSVFLQTTRGVFEPHAVPLGGMAGTSFPFDLEIADVDGDGDLDLLTANQDSSTVAIYYNDHGG